MFFRPYPILTFIALPILAALIALGVWQVQRAQWKAGLIIDFERAAATEPATSEAALCDQNQEPIGRVVTLGEARGLQLRVFGHNWAGDAGWRLFHAVKRACDSSTAAVLAETGFEALRIGDLPARAPALGAKNKYIIEAFPKRQFMAASNAPERNEWHWFDPAAMSAFLGADRIDPRYILARLEGVPDHLVRTPPSGHIGYAFTWFGMAIAFGVIYALFHAQAGRLRFGTRT